MKLWDNVGDPCTFKGFARLFMFCFVQKIFAIKSRSRQKPNECKRCLAPNFWEKLPRRFWGRF